MAKFEQGRGSEIPSGDRNANGESTLQSEARQLAAIGLKLGTATRHEQISPAEKQFGDDFRRSQREYIGVESGRNPQTGATDGKPMASSETLMRAEAHMVYSALHSHNAKERAAATGSLKNEKYDPGSEESVYQAYLSSQRKHEHVGSNASADQIENARVHNAYVADKKHGTKIEFD